MPGFSAVSVFMSELYRKYKELCKLFMVVLFVQSICQPMASSHSKYFKFGIMSMMIL